MTRTTFTRQPLVFTLDPQSNYWKLRDRLFKRSSITFTNIVPAFSSLYALLGVFFQEVGVDK